MPGSGPLPTAGRWDLQRPWFLLSQSPLLVVADPVAAGSSYRTEECAPRLLTLVPGGDLGRVTLALKSLSHQLGTGSGCGPFTEREVLIDEHVCLQEQELRFVL